MRRFVAFITDMFHGGCQKRMETHGRAEVLPWPSMSPRSARTASSSLESPQTPWRLNDTRLAVALTDPVLDGWGAHESVFELLEPHRVIA